MDLATAIEQYKETAPWARGGLAAFLTYCDASDTRALNPDQLIGFCQAIVGRGLALSTMHSYRSAVRNFFRWLLEHDLASFSASALEEALVQQSPLAPPAHPWTMQAPQETEVRQLIEAVYAAAPGLSPQTLTGKLAHLSHLRNIAIVELLRATGARPTELVALCLGDLDLENQVATAPDGRLLYFDLRSWGALMHYLLFRRDPVDLPLFYQQLPLFAQHPAGSASRSPRPLNVRMITQLLRDLRASPTLTPRSLRIRFGRSLLAATADERGTARLLGLKTLASVRRYMER